MYERLKARPRSVGYNAEEKISTCSQHFCTPKPHSSFGDHPPQVKREEKKNSVSIQTIVVLFVLV